MFAYIKLWLLNPIITRKVKDFYLAFGYIGSFFYLKPGIIGNKLDLTS